MALHLETRSKHSTMLHTVTSLTLVIRTSCSAAEPAQSIFAAMKKQNIQLNLPIIHYSKTKRYIYTTVLSHLFFFVMANLKTCNGQWVCSNRLVKLPPTSTRNRTCCWISEFTRLSCHGLHPPWYFECSLKHPLGTAYHNPCNTVRQGVYLPWTYTTSCTYKTTLIDGTRIYDQWLESE